MLHATANAMRRYVDGLAMRLTAVGTARRGSL